MRKETAWFGVPALLWLLFHAPVLFGGKAYAFLDASRYFYPAWKKGAEALRSGLLPLWNPDLGAGAPHLADPQTAALYPPLVAAYGILPPAAAFTFLLCAHHLYALLGAFLYLRAESRGGPAAALGAIMFGFALHAAGTFGVPAAALALSHLPWVFQAAARMREGKRRAFPALAALLALQAAAGYPVLAYVTGAALFVETFLASAPERRLREAVRVLGAGALAGALNAAWLLPFAELSRFSSLTRGAGPHLDLRLRDLVTFLSPFAEGHPLEGGGPVRPDRVYWAAAYFLGLPTLALAASGLLSSKSPRGARIGSLLFLVLSQGTVLGAILKALVPGMALVVRSGFWIAPFLLHAARLAAAKTDALLEGKGKPPLRLLAAAVLAFGGAALLGGWGAAGGLTAALLFAGALLLPSAGGRRGGRLGTAPAWRGGGLLAAAAVSLFPAAKTTTLALPTSFYEEPPLLASALHPEDRMLHSPRLLASLRVLPGERAESAYLSAKEALFPNQPLTFGAACLLPYGTLTFEPTVQWFLEASSLSRDHSRKVLDYLGARVVVGKTSFEGLRSLSEAAGQPVSENPRAFPRWFTVPLGVPAGARVADFRKVEAMPGGYREIALVEGWKGLRRLETRRVRFRRLSPQEVELEAPGKGNALLVSSEAHYPGWRARVEGNPREVLRVNHVFQGLELLPGERRVSLSFVPVSFRLGLFLSLLAFGVWSFLGFLPQGARP